MRAAAGLKSRFRRKVPEEGSGGRFRRKVPEEGSGGRFRRVPACAGVGSGGNFRKIPEVTSGRFRRVPCRFQRQLPERSGGFRCVLV